MAQHAFKSWTQGAGLAGAAQPHALCVLLRLAREGEAALQTDLREVAAARAAVARSLQGIRAGAVERRCALRRLGSSLERSEAGIASKLEVVRREAARLAALMSRDGVV